MAEAETRKLYRDKRFDDGIMPALLLLLGVTVFMVFPIVFAYAFVSMEYRTKNPGTTLSYMVKPQTPEFMFSSLLIPLAIVFAGVSTYYLSRNFAVGNKYKIYLLNENGQLFYTHMGKGSIYSYFKDNVSLKEKMESVPNLFYSVFARSGIRTMRGLYLPRMELFFKYNKKHKLAERLLSSEDYKAYCHQVVSVRNMKFFAGGCTVNFGMLINGVEKFETCQIYTSMEGYKTVIGKLKELYESAGTRLGRSQVSYLEKQDATNAFAFSQIRREIIRKNVVSIIFMLCFLTLAIVALMQSESLSEDIAKHDYAVPKRIFRWLRGRTVNRAYLSCAWVFLSLLTVIKGVWELLSAKRYQMQEVTVLQYFAKRKRDVVAEADNFKYFASIEYYQGENLISATVGVSPALYENRENAEPLLVMKKDLPYMLVMR